MIRLDEVRARIEGKVGNLQGRMRNAGEFADLVERNAFPADPVSAFVLPGNLNGGSPRSISAAFIQDFAETIIVVLVARVANDPTGAKALDTLTPLVRNVVTAVCGWGPDDAPGVFALGSGELVGSAQGRLIYHLEFNLNDQLRIIP